MHLIQLYPSWNNGINDLWQQVRLIFSVGTKEFKPSILDYCFKS